MILFLSLGTLLLYWLGILYLRYFFVVSIGKESIQVSNLFGYQVEEYYFNEILSAYISNQKASELSYNAISLMREASILRVIIILNRNPNVIFSERKYLRRAVYPKDVKSFFDELKTHLTINN